MNTSTNTAATGLKKDLGLFKVFSIALGTTLSAGFFLLPGIATKAAGPGMILSYILAAIPLIPSMLSIVELATAMPKAGGTYYFLDRSMGPLIGTIGGLGTWLALMLKTSFALIGMGYYLHIFFPNSPTIPIAIMFAIGFGLLNLFGAKKSASLQVFLVIGLLTILLLFILAGLPNVEPTHFEGFFDKGIDKVLSTAGLVYISYVGITKIASVAEEIQNPERNLPLGVFLAMGLSVLIYAFGTFVMVGLVPVAELQNDLTPVATAAKIVAGRPGQVVLTIAALMAFASVANAGILSASRYPLAMGRDRLLPRFFGRITQSGTPIVGVISTVSIIVLVLLAFDPTKIAKLASAFQLLMFAMICLAVIVMRESQIESYDPSYKSPFYPWMQIVGIVIPIWLISAMGSLPVLFTIGLLLSSGAWYFKYARKRVARDGAIYHVFERLGRNRYEPLEIELRTILKERGARESDPFEETVARAQFADITEPQAFDEVLNLGARMLAQRVETTSASILDSFNEDTRTGSTPTDRGVAILHARFPNLSRPKLLLARTALGVTVPNERPPSRGARGADVVNAFVFLVSDQDQAGQHLRLLAQIAQHIDQEGFMDQWLIAKGEREIKELLLRDEQSLTLQLTKDSAASDWIGRQIQELSLPDGCLIAMIHRKHKSHVPRGNSELQEGDQLTMIGSPKVIRELSTKYVARLSLDSAND